MICVMSLVRGRNVFADVMLQMGMGVSEKHFMLFEKTLLKMWQQQLPIMLWKISHSPVQQMKRKAKELCRKLCSCFKNVIRRYMNMIILILVLLASRIMWKQSSVRNAVILGGMQCFFVISKMNRLVLFPYFCHIAQLCYQLCLCPPNVPIPVEKLLTVSVCSPITFVFSVFSCHKELQVRTVVTTPRCSPSLSLHLD